MGIPAASKSMSKRICDVILMLMVCFTFMAQAQSPTMIGRWNIEITFGDGSQRALHFEAQDAGKGTFQVVDPRLKVWGPGKPSEAKWTREIGRASCRERG